MSDWICFFQGERVLRGERGLRSWVKEKSKIQCAGFPVVDGNVGLKEVRSSDEFIHFPNSQFCHVLADFLCHEKEIIDDVFGLACKLLSEFRILSRYAHRTRVEMALAHHDTALDNERSC